MFLVMVGETVVLKTTDIVKAEEMYKLHYRGGAELYRLMEKASVK